MRNTTRVTLGAAAVSIPLIAAVTVLPASASSRAPAPIAVEPLTPRSAFTDDLMLQLKVKGHHGNHNVRLHEPSLTAVVRITVQPGAHFPQHHHPGPVIVNVAAGELTYVDAQCGRKAYQAGTAFLDTGTDVHSAFGSSSGPTVLIATFLGAPATGPLTIPEAVQVPCG